MGGRGRERVGREGRRAVASVKGPPVAMGGWCGPSKWKLGRERGNRALVIVF